MEAPRFRTAREFRHWYRTVYLKCKYWRKLSRAMKQEAGWSCEVCGRHLGWHYFLGLFPYYVNIAVHHKGKAAYKRLYRERRRDVMVVCNRCHSLIHLVYNFLKLLRWVAS